MAYITFSHAYHKLKNADGDTISTAQLLSVCPVQLETLSDPFLAYDTDDGRFQLPKQGAFLMLMFLKPGDRDLFTTLRRSTPNKEAYYRSMIGCFFEVKIEEKP